MYATNMSVEATQTSKTKASRAKPAILGRSAATGKFVLVPATNKGGTITMQAANSAVKNISSKK
jgi:hypothetical protein